MANKGTAGISAEFFNDFARMSMSGNLSYTPADIADKWIYKEVIADASSTPLIQVGIEYQDRYIRTDQAETVTAGGDIIRWMAIKHTGTTNGTTATSAGVMVSLDQSGNAAFDEEEGFFIDSGEFFCFKTANCSISVTGVITVAVTNGIPVTGGSPGDVLLQVAAILDDESVTP